TALRIWDLLAQPVRGRSVVETLCAEFAVDATQCAAEVLTFLQTLEAKGLVVRVAAESTA
ncbi:MAG: PqqD family protein, partial [Gemmatimonadaceae bacterium]|nr:PqqD family protein [Gemmatimonadaceae bacterium]